MLTALDSYQVICLHVFKYKWTGDKMQFSTDLPVSTLHSRQTELHAIRDFICAYQSSLQPSGETFPHLKGQWHTVQFVSQRCRWTGWSKERENAVCTDLLVGFALRVAGVHGGGDATGHISLVACLTVLQHLTKVIQLTGALPHATRQQATDVPTVSFSRK